MNCTKAEGKSLLPEFKLGLKSTADRSIISLLSSKVSTLNLGRSVILQKNKDAKNRNIRGWSIR